MRVLQSDNGRELCNAVIISMKELWPELHIVHGKPRNSQSQGSVERANQDVENMIFTWMADHASTRWSQSLRFVQFMKNRSFHADIQRSLYEAMFGCHPKVGLDLPEVVLKTLRTEEELKEAFESTQRTSANPDDLTLDDYSGTRTSRRIVDHCTSMHFVWDRCYAIARSKVCSLSQKGHLSQEEGVA